MTASGMRIGELAERFGLAAHVLRHWEAMGLLTPAARVNGRRVYTEDHLVRVATIVRAKAGGMSLERIGRMLQASGPDERRELLRRQHAELERRLAEIAASKRLIEHVLECDAEDFTRCPDYRRVIESGIGAEPDTCVGPA
ncbi:helix-turn-helix domain-containing protein [Nonomuraea rhodomycinica]|nr:MerR family transcriptional regulator [Nonomuraea rhodomycinica]